MLNLLAVNHRPITGDLVCQRPSSMRADEGLPLCASGWPLGTSRPLPREHIHAAPSKNKPAAAPR